MSRYEVVPETSTVVIEARSSVGPIVWEATHPTGWVEAHVAGDNGTIELAARPQAVVEVDVGRLTSGNEVYDAELLRRIDARRHPRARIELEQVHAGAGPGRFRVTGTMRFHGVRRRLEGTVSVDVATPEKLVVTGEKVVDIRDFDVPAPSMLMLRIYPDVRVHLFLEAKAGG